MASTRGGTPLSKSRITDFRYQLLATGALFFGLFFIEYPPIFLLGYWSWSGAAHKILSGIIIVLNLVITQYVVRRWGFFRQAQKAGSAGAQPSPEARTAQEEGEPGAQPSAKSSD